MEDVEPEPPSAVTLFGDRIELARAFTADLVARGELLGLIGPLELPRIWTRHVLNSALLARLVRPGVVGDVGTGAGLPGLVLAIARPDARFVLIEPMERRTDWLHEQVDALGLANVTIERARAQESVHRGALDQVTARAVSALKTLIPAVAPLVRAGGELILMKGMRVESERDAAAKQIARAKLSEVEVLELTEPGLSESTRVFRATVG